jgi:hypothetical protein
MIVKHSKLFQVPSARMHASPKNESISLSLFFFHKKSGTELLATNVSSIKGCNNNNNNNYYYNNNNYKPPTT